MKDKVDAEKIINHIKYTKHWLDQADEDYKNKRFGAGSMILGLARAELTSAWEEAMQLKTQVFRTMPKQARRMANWKSASAVGLLASGFLIAFMITQFSNPALMNTGQQNVEQIVVTTPASPAPKSAAKARPGKTAPAVVPVPVAIQPQIIQVEPDQAAPEKQQIRAAAPVYRAPRAIRRAAPAVAAPQPKIEILPQSAPPAPKPVAAPQPAPVVQPAPQPIRVITVTTKEKSYLDDIDLYNTANDAIMK